MDAYHWVRPELDTLFDALTRDLEQLASRCDEQETFDEGALRPLLARIEQLRGTLVMLNLVPLLPVLDSMQLLAAALAKSDQRVDQVDALVEVALQCPDLVETAAHLDDAEQMGLLVWPLLNRLRQAQGLMPLDEPPMHPDRLRRLVPPLAANDDGAGDARVLVREIRRARTRFQRALLQLMQSDNVWSAAEQLAQICNHLVAVMPQVDLRRLLWVSGALLDAISRGAEHPTAEIKRLFGRVDRQIGEYLRAAEDHLREGHFSLDEFPPELHVVPGELVQSLLQIVSQPEFDDDRTRALRLELRGSGPALATGAPEAGENPTLISGPGRTVLAHLERAVSEDLVEIRERLEVLLGGAHEDRAALVAVAEKLARLADTILIAGDARSSRKAQDIAGLLRVPDDSETPQSRDTVAIGIIELEQNLDAFFDRSGARDPSSNETPIDVRGTVFAEILISLGKAKDDLLLLFADADRETRGRVVAWLDRIHGALLMTGIQSIARLAARIRDAVDGTVDDAMAWRRDDVASALAEALASAEVAVESLQHPMVDLDAVLERGHRALDDFDRAFAPGDRAGNAPGAALGDEPGSALGNVPGGIPGASREAEAPAAPGLVQAVEPETGMGTRPPLVSTSDADHGAILGAGASAVYGTISQDDSNQDETVATSGPGGSRAVSFTFDRARLQGDPVASHSDAEIRAIFVEEAAGEAASLAACWPLHARPGGDLGPDVVTLSNIRRVFHTLKGSGRMAGAFRLGEFAWVAEAFLNELQRTGGSPDAQALAAIGDAIEVLPALIDEVRDAGTAHVPVLDIALRLQTLAVVVDDEDPADDLESDDVAGTVPKGRVIDDSDLWLIFCDEARDHLETIGIFLTAALGANLEGRGSATPTEALTRAVHTLHGNARSLDLPRIYRLCSPLERLLTHALERGDALDDVILEALGQLRQQTFAVLDARDGHLGGDVLRREAETLALLVEREQGIELESAGTTWQDDIDAAATESLQAGVPESARGDRVDSVAKAQVETPPEWGPQARDGARDTAAEHASRDTSDADLTHAAARDDPQASQHAPHGDALGPSETREGGPKSSVDDRETDRSGVNVLRSADDTGLRTASIDHEFGEIFLEEAGDIVEVAERAMHDWESGTSFAAQEARRSFLREIHTLKGSARMAGFLQIGALSHAVETAENRESETFGDARPEFFALLRQALGDIQRLVRAGICDEQRLDTSMPILEQLQAWPTAVVMPESTAFEAAAIATLSEVRDPAVRDPAANVERRDAYDAPTQEHVRVRTALLDTMVNEAGEILTFQRRVEQGIGRLDLQLDELLRTIQRLRQQLRMLEIETETQILFRVDSGPPESGFDPLELDRYSTVQQLSRALAESVSDLESLYQDVGSGVRGADSILRQQGRVVDELQAQLSSQRLVSFARSLPRLRRVAMQAAEETGKEVDLRVEGAEVELDRAVLDRLIGPLEHLLRNALVHGIEARDDRVMVGKAGRGTLRISVKQVAGEFHLDVADDGRGVDADRVRARAVEIGLLDADSEMRDEECHQLILQPGFSTLDEVSELAGRGVGLDVVHSEVKQLGGRLLVASRSGRGSQFQIRVPLTLTVLKSLIISRDDQVYAIALAGIEGVVRLHPAEIGSDGQGRWFDHVGRTIRLLDFGALIDPDRSHGAPFVLPEQPFAVLLVREDGGSSTAVFVDTIRQSQEVVVKSVGPILSRLPAIAGATLSADGDVQLIIDLPALLRFHSVTKPRIDFVEEPLAQVPRVMVVDDSITIRKVTARLLERNGFDVATARDGLDAVALLEEHQPHLILLDVEMPRMDGFEFATHVREHPRLASTPIVMITSRTGAKHRDRAMRIGVNGYLGKPFLEQELLLEIRQWIAKERDPVETPSAPGWLLEKDDD